MFEYDKNLNLGFITDTDKLIQVEINLSPLQINT